MYTNIVSSSRLSGIQKASIIVLALDDSMVESVLSNLEENELKELSQIMSNIGRVDSVIIEDVVNEFIARFGSSNPVFGNQDATERLLMKVLPQDKVNEIMTSIKGARGRSMWDKLSNVNESVLANYLKNEYPQSVAVILSKISSEHASRVITHFSETFVLDVMTRMLSLESIQDEVMATVESTLATEFVDKLSQARIRDGHQVLADIFNNFDRPSADQMLELLETKDFDAAERIRSLMFTFEDLIGLEPVYLQILIRHTPRDKLTVGLKGAAESVVKIFMNNLSERAGRILREDMASLGPTRLRVIEEAQVEIVNIAKGLADNGDIDLAQGSKKEQYVR